MPVWMSSYIESVIMNLFKPLKTEITIMINDWCDMDRNEDYESAEIYLSKKISPATMHRFKVFRTSKQNNINLSMDKNQRITDEYRDIKIIWSFVCTPAQKDRSNGYTWEIRHFEIRFRKEHRDVVVNDYLPFVVERAREIRDDDKVVKLYTSSCSSREENGSWGSINLDHPATFDKLAMDSVTKRALIEDLDNFLERKDYYRRVGKAWKRGYLLYGPPGSGQSTLVAAIANYLKFDVYDINLTSIHSNSQLRRILSSTKNRSIILIEDIDCNMEMHDPKLQDIDFEDDNDDDIDDLGFEDTKNKLTLSGLLNFIDGLWSNCGDERLIIFTTNYKEKLDPALIRPGRMDRHVHMSYCTLDGFKTLASNYLGINEEDNNQLWFNQIETLIKNVEVTSAEIAEELLRNSDQDVDVAMEAVIKFLEKKQAQVNNEKSKEDEDEEEEEEEEEEAPFPSLKERRKTKLGKLRRRRHVKKVPETGAIKGCVPAGIK